MERPIFSSWAILPAITLAEFAGRPHDIAPPYSADMLHKPLAILSEKEPPPSMPTPQAEKSALLWRIFSVNSARIENG